ncbi:MAG TPA: fused MFS/spermidine synthase, partial [Caulobacteraceae bacterium]|nr:fused MFS/spermidine synthase [Caulobacteraceae bacterium]
AALATYPTLAEPNLSLLQQSGLWSAGYLVVTGLALACAAATALVGRAGPPAASTPAEQAPASARATWLQRGRWLVLALVPSSLLLGVTTHLTMNIAAAPLFWAVPLGLYLLSFILAFQTLVPLPLAWTSWLQAALLTALAVTFLTAEAAPSLTLFALNLAAFFITALLCHQLLAAERPTPARLTEFYLVVALGGALGGAFNALLAPVIFQRVVEYPLMLVAACLLRPGGWPKRAQAQSGMLDLIIPAALLIDLMALASLVGLDLTDLNGAAQVIVVITALVVFAAQARPVRFALAFGALSVAGAYAAGAFGPELARARNYYGILSVIDHAKPPVRVLINGTIEHGAQSLDPARRLQPLGYYHHAGPLGSLFARIGGGPLTQSVATVGLGSGSVACYAEAGEHWTFYEINPAVVRIASNPRLFTFLRDCPAHPAIVLGDARLSLERAPDHAFGLILLDAFSSDAIPTHLMTREAVRLYSAKLRPGGLIVFHVSNQFLDLAPVVESVANAEGLGALDFNDENATNTGDAPTNPATTDYKDASEWVVVGRTADLAPLAIDKGWRPLQPTRGVRAWTDDYSDVFGALIRRQRLAPSP